MEQETVVQGRGVWDSRIAFWLATCGSAVGLGNLWRFPWKVSQFGGGAFLVAYFIALFLIGMPLLTQEMALGARFRGGDVEAYGRINPRLRGLGLASVVGAFAIVTYYSVVIAYSFIFMCKSFYKDLPWEEDPNNYFKNKVQIRAPAIDETNNVMPIELLASTILVWVCIFYCVRNGVKSMSKVVLISMPVPVLCLIIMLIKGLTLEGASDGINAYLNDFDADLLKDSKIWNSAIGQVFFSLSICMGVMTAYTSFTEKGQNIATDEKVVAFCDVAIAFLSGFVIYAGLGHMEKVSPQLDPVTGAVVEGAWYTQASFGLVFVAYPQVLSTFDGASTNIFGIIFFMALFLLGIDSAFSMVEACSTCLADTDLIRKRGYTRPQISSGVCIIGFMCSLIFCADTGFYYLDIVDHYVNEYGMIFIGMMECIAVGWVFRSEVSVAKVGDKAFRLWAMFYWGGLFTGIMLGLGLAGYTDGPAPPEGSCGHWNGIMGQDSIAVALPVTGFIWVLGFILGHCAAKQHNANMSFVESTWALLGWHGAEDLREGINRASDFNFRAGDTTSEVRALWDFSMLNCTWGFQIKYFIPTLLLLLLCDIMRKEAYQGYGCHAYPGGYIAIGVLIFCAMVVCVMMTVFFPSLMEQDFDKLEAAARQQYLDEAAKDFGEEKHLPINADEMPQKSTSQKGLIGEGTTQGVLIGEVTLPTSETEMQATNGDANGTNQELEV